MGNAAKIQLRAATLDDVPLILSFIQQLAEYEKLAHTVVATEKLLQETLFGERPAAEVVIASWEDTPVGFSLFFTNYSTFLARPGLYLEDLFVLPEFRGRGVGKALLKYLARLAKERDYGRFEWSVLDWNEPAIKVYKGIGAIPMDEWTIFRVTGEALDHLAQS
jgi:GNAT superfamily N-acetyltransferase